MLRSDNEFWFRYPVYNPAISVLDAVADWGRDIFEGTLDLDLVLAQPFRVAALPIFYDRPGTWSHVPGLADLDLDQFDLVLFSDPEYHDLQEVRAWLPTANAVVATGGISELTVIDPRREVYRPYYIRDFIEQNTYQDTTALDKPYRFEALLGARRPHRDFVWKALHRCGLLEQNIVTYRSGFPGAIQDYLTDIVSARLGTDLQWPYVSPNLDPDWEVSAAVTNRDSRLSPIEIYRRTWYSIICETLFTGRSFFLSEKTIKAMFNRRVFVLFGPANYLAQLHEHGFETFRHSLDESYDQETRDPVRYEQVLQQIWRLAWLEDPIEIYNSMRSVLDHNHQRLFELELKRGRDQRDLLMRHIPNQHWHWPPIQIS